MARGTSVENRFVASAAMSSDWERCDWLMASFRCTTASPPSTRATTRAMLTPTSRRR